MEEKEKRKPVILGFQKSQIANDIWKLLMNLSSVMGERAMAAFEGVVPADAPLSSFEELLDYFREFPDEREGVIPYEYRESLRAHKFYGLEDEDSYGCGGIWAVYSPDDTQHLGWLISTTSHWALLAPWGELIDRDARKRTSRWFGAPAAPTKWQREAKKDMLAGNPPHRKST